MDYFDQLDSFTRILIIPAKFLKQLRTNEKKKLLLSKNKLKPLFSKMSYFEMIKTLTFVTKITFKIFVLQKFIEISFIIVRKTFGVFNDNNANKITTYTKVTSTLLLLESR